MTLCGTGSATKREVQKMGGAEDVTDNGDTWMIITGPSDLAVVRSGLEAAGYKNLPCELNYHLLPPENTRFLSLKTAMSVGQASGVALVAAANFSASVASYSSQSKGNEIWFFSAKSAWLFAPWAEIPKTFAPKESKSFNDVEYDLS